MNGLREDLLQEILERVVAALHPVEVYLFGSQGDGSSDADSDIDLLVVVEDTGESTREMARRGRRSLWGMAVPVDLLVCTVNEKNKWAGVNCNLIHTAVEQGRRVYDTTG